MRGIFYPFQYTLEERKNPHTDATINMTMKLRFVVLLMDRYYRKFPALIEYTHPFLFNIIYILIFGEKYNWIPSSVARHWCCLRVVAVR